MQLYRINLVLLCLSCGGVGCASISETKAPLPDLGSAGGSPSAVDVPAGPAPGQGAFALGSGDVLSIRVFREPELSGDFMVDADGAIRFPLIGAVNVSGLTPNEIAQRLTEQLGGNYLRSPQVTVLLKEANSRKVSVLGQVSKPGTFSYQDQLSLVEAITLAGGLDKLADAGRVKITRLKEGQELHFVVALNRILDGRAPNLELRPGDVVFVPESMF